MGLEPPAGIAPFGGAVESSDNILVTDYSAGTVGFGALFRVDPTTGVRTLLSDFGDGANQGVDPYGVVVVPEQSRPVGGVVMPTSKLEIVAPLAALAGLIVAVSAVVVVKKRRD